VRICRIIEVRPSGLDGIDLKMSGLQDNMEHELIVIGGGAAGLAAARAARRRGASVTLVSEGPLGGDCTFLGCVPSKTLLRSARQGLDFDAAMSEVRRVVASIAAEEDEDQLRGEGIEVLRGRATFINDATIDVSGTTLRSKRFIIATGAGPFVPPIPGLQDGVFLTNENVFSQRSLPARMAILGGGPIGVEMAEAFARLGSVVSVVEAAPRLLPREEMEASVVLKEHLEGLGVSVRVATTCTSVEVAGGSTRLGFNVGPVLEVDALLVAVGRRPSSSGLGLDATGVKVDARGFIEVDAKMRTSSPHIYAAGDVAQSLQFTHVADETGRIAVGNALSRLAIRRFHPEWIPMVTYTDLEVARVGITEDQAPSGSRVAYLPMAEFDRARMSGDDRGFVKIIVGPRRITRNLAGGSIVGATIVAPRAGEMIQEIVLAMRAGLFPARLATATHAYPSWSMAVQLAAAQFFGDFGGRTGRPSKKME